MAVSTKEMTTTRYGVLVMLLPVGWACTGTMEQGTDGLDVPDTLPAECRYEEPKGPVFHVATTGDDNTGDGSEANPWPPSTMR